MIFAGVVPLGPLEGVCLFKISRPKESGASFTKPPLERTSFSKRRSFFSFGKAILNFSFTKPLLTLLTEGLP